MVRNVENVNDLTQSESVLGAGRAREGIDIIRLLVGFRAVAVTGRAGGRGAARVTGNSREARLNEVGVGVKVDRRHVPVQVVTVEGVLELKYAVFILRGRQLDRDATAIGVGGPAFAVGAAVGVESLHFTGAGRGGPEIDIGVHVVHDLQGTTGRGVVTGHLGVRQSHSSGGKDA